MIEVSKTEYYSIMDLSISRVDGVLIANGETQEEAINKFIKEAQEIKKKCENNIQILNDLISQAENYKIT